MELIQSIQRAASILRCLGRENPKGKRLVDIARETGLNNVTARRILGTLNSEGLVDWNADTGLFRLGLGLFELAQSAGNENGIYGLVFPAMIRLAELTGDTVYLQIRDGMEAICLERVEGSFPIKTLTLKAGDRRPLGVGAGSLALLAFLPEPEMEAILEENSPKFSNFGELDPADVPRLVSLAREQGYGSVDGHVLPGMSAVSVPIHEEQGKPFASLSVAAITSRLQGDRRTQVVAWIKQEVAAIERRLPRDERFSTFKLKGILAANRNK